MAFRDEQCQEWKVDGSYGAINSTLRHSYPTRQHVDTWISDQYVNIPPHLDQTTLEGLYRSIDVGVCFSGSDHNGLSHAATQVATRWNGNEETRFNLASLSALNANQQISQSSYASTQAAVQVECQPDSGYGALGDSAFTSFSMVQDDILQGEFRSDARTLPQIFATNPDRAASWETPDNQISPYGLYSQSQQRNSPRQTYLSLPQVDVQRQEIALESKWAPYQIELAEQELAAAWNANEVAQLSNDAFGMRFGALSTADTVSQMHHHTRSGLEHRTAPSASTPSMTRSASLSSSEDLARAHISPIGGWSPTHPQTTAAEVDVDELPHMDYSRLHPAAAAEKRSLDARLVHLRDLGWSYARIRKEGGFHQGESTLRGRYRTLTKPKDRRVRKPEWKRNDVSRRGKVVVRTGILIIYIEATLEGGGLRYCQ